MPAEQRCIKTGSRIALVSAGVGLMLGHVIEDVMGVRASVMKTATALSAIAVKTTIVPMISGVARMGTTTVVNATTKNG